MKSFITTQLQFLSLQNAWKNITRNDGITTVNVLDDLESQQGKFLSEIARQSSNELNLGFDQAYEMLYDALNTIDSDNLANPSYISDQEYNSLEFASMYTHNRLQYLTVNNQYDITQILLETQCEDIQTACGIWYDRVCVSILDNVFAGLDEITDFPR